MNELSTLLYAASVVNQLSVVAAIVSIIAGFAAVACSVFLIGAKISGEGEDESFRYLSRINNRVWVTAVIAFLIVVFLPNSDTVKMIAVSQVGEQILATPEVREGTNEAGAIALDSLKLLHQYLEEIVKK